MLHRETLLVFAAQLFGYVALSSALQLAFYGSNARRAQWKTQPNAPPLSPRRWPLPARDLLLPPAVRAPPQHPRRHPKHALFATLNLLVSSLFAAATAVRDTCEFATVVCLRVGL